MPDITNLKKLASVCQARRVLCYTCPTPCNPLPRVSDFEYRCPLNRWPDTAMEKRGLGNWVSKFATPVARALRSDCIDKEGHVKPESGCGKRIRWLNNMTPRRA